MPCFSCNQDSHIVKDEPAITVQTDDNNHSRRDFKMIGFIIIMIMYLALLTWAVERLVRTKNKKIKNLSYLTSNLETQNNHLSEEVANEQLHNSKLNEEFKKLKSECIELQILIDKINRNKSESRVLKQILNKIDSYSTHLYLSPKDMIGMYLRTDKFLNEIDNIVDGYSKGFMDSVKLSFPKMKLSRLRLVRYLYAGFSTEAMMYLFDYHNRAKLDNGKWLLKKNIIENPNWKNLDAKTMLSKLKYKS